MNYYINKSPNGSGSLDYISTSLPFELVPSHLVEATAEQFEFFMQCSQFVSIRYEENQNKVVSITDNPAAREEWENRPQPTPEPTTEETMLELMADQEYRLCMIELGLN